LFSFDFSIVKNMGSSRTLYTSALLVGALTLLSIACVKSWQATPKPELSSLYEQCNNLSNEEVQMLFIPGYAESVILVEDCSRYRRERVSIALQTFEVAWEDKFGRLPSVRLALRTMLIGFSREPRKFTVAYDMDGKRFEDGHLVGETMAPNMIWVHAGNKPRICDTSFVHELIHASIWAQGFDRGDPDHLGEKYHGWTHEHNILLQEVNQRLCVLGI